MLLPYLKSLFILKYTISKKFDMDSFINISSVLNLYKCYIIIATMVLSAVYFFIFIPSFAESQNVSSSTRNTTEIETLINKANNFYEQEKYNEALEYMTKCYL